MSDASDRLLDAALRPLAEQPERRQAARTLLEGMVQASHPDADAIIARWEVVDGRKHRAVWRRVLVVALAVLSAWVLGGAVGEAWRYKRVLGWFGHFGTGWPAEPRELLGEGLSERDRFLLFGDLLVKPESERMRALWGSEPDNASDFAAYAFAYGAENRAFPPDFLATAQRLDPDNSWFTYHAAGVLAKDSVKRDRQTSQARKAGEAPSWKILNETTHKQALALLREAGRQKHFVNRQKEFVALRVPLLPQTDQVSRLVTEVYIGEHAGTDFNLRCLAETIAAQAWLLGEAGDAAGFEALLGDVDLFIKAWAGMKHPRLRDVMILKTSCLVMTRNLHVAAEQLGLHDEARQIKEISNRFAQGMEHQDMGRSTREIDMRGSLGNDSSIRNRWLVKAPPPLSDADLKPGRMAEHLLVARLASLAVWTLLGLGIVAVALFRFCWPKPVLYLARRVNALLGPADWAWLLGAGVLLPFGYVTALMRCTPLGGQDWGLIRGCALIVAAADFSALGLLLLVVPALIARWRLGRRAAALGVCSDSPRLGWLAVAAAATLVPVIGMAAPPFSDIQLASRVGLLAMLVPLVLGILISLVRALAVKFTRQFSRAVVALTLIPVYASGMLLIMASMPLYQAAQAGWERRDAMSELTADGITRYDGEVAKQMLQEVRAALELDAGR